MPKTIKVSYANEQARVKVNFRQYLTLSKNKNKNLKQKLNFKAPAEKTGLVLYFIEY